MRTTVVRIVLFNMKMIVALKGIKSMLCILSFGSVALADVILPVLTHSSDPHACLLFTQPNGNGVFKCCDGYYKNEMANLTENCAECPAGLYGSNCQLKCECLNGATCSNVDGSCLCSGFYFGTSCEMPCNCHNGATCDGLDGSCVCQDGFYGELCQSECSCPVNYDCDGKSGKCNCKDGFYGDSCLPCNCSTNENCDPLHGQCTCKPGYYGDHCEKQCTCFNAASCTVTGEDFECRCSHGWTGSNCTSCDTYRTERNGRPFCENKCLQCYNGDTCTPADGGCRCTPGWQGNRCDRKCDEGFYGRDCLEVCRCENGNCDHVTGTCTCQNGWTGEHCETPCPDNCIHCKADFCTSCLPGWAGVHCDERCQSGFYGNGCRQSCLPCNCSITCHHVDGRCSNTERCEGNDCVCKNEGICFENPFMCKCPSGWSGTYCDERTDDKMNNAIAVGIFVVKKTTTKEVVEEPEPTPEEDCVSERSKATPEENCNETSKVPIYATVYEGSITSHSGHGTKRDENRRWQERHVLLNTPGPKACNCTVARKPHLENPYAVVSLDRFCVTDFSDFTDDTSYDGVDRTGKRYE